MRRYSYARMHPSEKHNILDLFWWQDRPQPQSPEEWLCSRSAIFSFRLSVHTLVFFAMLWISNGLKIILTDRQILLETMYTESIYRYLQISLVWSGPSPITARIIWTYMIFTGPYSNQANWRDIGNWTKADSASCPEQQKQPKRQQQPGQPQAIPAAPYRYTCPAVHVQLYLSIAIR